MGSNREPSRRILVKALLPEDESGLNMALDVTAQLDARGEQHACGFLQSCGYPQAHAEAIVKAAVLRRQDSNAWQSVLPTELQGEVQSVVTIPLANGKFASTFWVFGGTPFTTESVGGQTLGW